MSHARTVACAALLLGAPLGAQIASPGTPLTDRVDLVTPVPTEVLGNVDVAQLLAEDAVNGPFPLRYGAVIDTGFGLWDHGVWEEAEGTDALVWRLRIESPGAHTLGVVFTDYHLPEGVQLFLYNDGKEEVLGAFGTQNNNENDVLGIRPIGGDAVTIELVQPASVVELPRLEIGEVIHDYKDVRQIMTSTSAPAGDPGPADGGCGLVGINCPEGSPYQDVKRSVMRTLVGGGLCSAALLNNTSQNAVPYMLTANHCGFMVAGVFTFNYEQSTCGTLFGSESQWLAGASQLAASAAYDSQLYRLNTTPPASFDPHYAGWSRSTAIGSPSTTIGHANGGPKNLAIDNSGAVIAGSDWQAFWHTGYILGGNSGGPLFDSQGRVIGPACCVNFFTCGIQTAWFGRFDLFYNAGNLGQWLDPAGTGAVTLGGYDPFANLAVVTLITPNTVPVFAPGTITLKGANFTGATAVKVGTTTLTAPLGFTVVDDNTITFGAPSGSTLGSVNVVIEKPVGDSNPIGLTYEVTDPPKLTATALSLTGFAANWNFGADPDDLWFLFVAVNDPTTIPFGGFDILLNTLLVTNGNLSPVGIGTHSLLVPPGASGALIYSQIVTLDDLTFGFSGATNVTTTSIL